MEGLDKFEGKKREATNEIFEKEVKNKKKDKKNKKNKNKNKNKASEVDEAEYQKQRQLKKEGWLSGKAFDRKRDLKSEKFEHYYRTQLNQYFENEDQFQIFVDKMRDKLPTVFRINTANSYWKTFQKTLTDPNLIRDLLGGDDYGIKVVPTNLTNLPEWENLIYNLNIPRFEFRKNENLSNFHKFIQKSVDAGLCSRQEAVSMIPPMLMMVNKNDRVLDMCAAPGSKTAQFLESFYKKFDFFDVNSILNDSGCVLANDNNPERGNMMTHQLKRLNTAGMAVICHDAQFMPTLFDEKDEKILFDKILADVPCSSDAVMRKLPHKWRKWSPRDSFSLHKLQLQIIKRGIALLKVGGTIVYSTCSLNPIENEAVVSEVMKQYGSCLEIQDMSFAFEGSHCKFRPGLLNWKVFVDDKEDPNSQKLIEIMSKSDPKYAEVKDFVEETCFAPDLETAKKIKLNNCIRLLPHDGDTSGFFITVFKKIAPLPETREKSNKDKKLVQADKGMTFITHELEIVDWLKDYFGLSDKFPFDQLITHSKISKKINFVSKGVAKIINADKRNQLKLINVGVKMFAHNKEKNTEKNPNYSKWRICQDGLLYAIPFMSKRVFFTKEETFVKLIKQGEVMNDDLPDQDLRKEFSSKLGNVVLICVKNKPGEGFSFKEETYLKYLSDNFIDAVCLYTSHSRVITMLNKEHQHVFNLKFKI